MSQMAAPSRRRQLLEELERDPRNAGFLPLPGVQGSFAEPQRLSSSSSIGRINVGEINIGEVRGRARLMPTLCFSTCPLQSHFIPYQDTRLVSGRTGTHMEASKIKDAGGRSSILQNAIQSCTTQARIKGRHVWRDVAHTHTWICLGIPRKLEGTEVHRPALAGRRGLTDVNAVCASAGRMRSLACSGLTTLQEADWLDLGRTRVHSYAKV